MVSFADNPRLERLRNALAMNRCIETLSQVVRNAEKTVEHDEAKRVIHLTDLLIQLHTDIFQDWKQQNVHRPGDMPRGEARGAVREAVLNILCANGTSDNPDAPPRGLFDSNGYVIYYDREKAAEILATFYEKMNSIKPFDYGNDLTLDTFMVALGKLPAFKEVYPAGIDLRRLDDADIKALHDSPGDIRGKAKALEHALDPNRTPPLKNIANGYGKWPKQVEYISGIQFLSHVKDNEKYLVTANGGLVPLKDIKGKLEAFLKSDELLADFPPVAAKKYLPGTEELQADGKREIDGAAVVGGAAPLLCLDVNIMTGLRSPAHKVLLAMIEQVRPGQKTPLFDLANNHSLKEELMHAAGDSKRRRIVEIGYQRISHVVDKLDRVKKRLLDPMEKPNVPKLYVSMGGAGVGKTAVEDIATAQCGMTKGDGHHKPVPNFVKASLDEFRKESDIYKVLVAAEHHGDDYATVEPFANTLREWVAIGAREKKLNLLYDGTGVVYQPRYADVVEDFKKEGYHTHVAAVDAMLVTPPGREKDFPGDDAVKRVQDRYNTIKRALPWIVVTGKHTRTPRSFIQAMEDPKLDKVSLFANDNGKGNHFLVAESFVMDNAELRALQAHQRGKHLAEHLKELSMEHKDSTLKNMTHSKEELAARMAKNGELMEDNVAYTSYASGGKNRVLVVYDTARYTDLMEKGLMNPHASYKEGLLQAPATVPFNIMQRVKEILNGPELKPSLAV